MNFAGALYRFRNLLLHPSKEWAEIATENKNRKTVFMQFVVPFLCMVTVASVIGALFSVSRTIYSFGYIACKIANMLCSLGGGLYISSFLIGEITAQYAGLKNHHRVFALMAYSSGAAYSVIVTVELFPFFSELLVLALYSCYLYWRGIPAVINIRGHKHMVFAVLSFIITTLVFLLMFYFFGNVFKAIFGIE